LGRPYQKELSRLAETYEWACTTTIEELVRGIAASAAKPLVAVGSGGSLSAAVLTATLHQAHTATIGRACTPMEIATAPAKADNASFLLFSGGGRNSDILAAFAYLVSHEPHRLIVATARANTPLAQLARRHRYVDVAELAVPAGRDGFLATNSLLAFAVAICRAYSGVFTPAYVHPPTLARLVGALTMGEFESSLRGRCHRLWEREVLVVLHGPQLAAAATDLESKFTEAALGVVQSADYRHFAHGRHHWLAKRGPASAVLAFVTDEDRKLAARTLGLLPKSIPAVTIDVGAGVPGHAALCGLVHALYIAGLAGEARGIDPGRPGVPSFGRALYHLGGLKGLATNRSCTPDERARAAITRKAARESVTVDFAAQNEFWDKSYTSFTRRLAATTFVGLVLDYDGTLCDERGRFTGPDQEVMAELVRLLRAGVPVGVATGRGGSAGDALRKAVPKRLWERVVVGYYNGGELAPLAEAARPTAGSPVDGLADLAGAMESDPRLSTIATFVSRRAQIAVRPRPPVPGDLVLALVSELAQQHGRGQLRVVASSHSVDVLAPGVSKLAVVGAVRGRSREPKRGRVLCIGDRGRWPGNDHALLSEPLSLSVHEVSTDPETCWNIAPPGHRGVQALLGYLRAVTARSGTFRLSLDKVGRMRK
jgi:fructoselysine-6-P-deglycase FrlB-like protein